MAQRKEADEYIITNSDRRMFKADANRIAKLCAGEAEDAREIGLAKRDFAAVVQKAVKAPLWTPENIRRFYPALMELAALADAHHQACL